MTTYQIITTDGGILVDAWQATESDVARRAQELANERGEAVTYYAVPVQHDEDDDAGTTVEPERQAAITINVYRSGGTWYGARWIDGDYDGCDALDVADDASETEAIQWATDELPLSVAGVRTVKRVEDDGEPERVMYGVVQCGRFSTQVYADRDDAQAEADRLNAEADDECGDEVLGDGAATVCEITTLYGFQARAEDGQWSTHAAGEQNASNLFPTRGQALAELPALAKALGCDVSELRVVELRTDGCES